MFTNERLFTMQAFTINRVHCNFKGLIERWKIYLSIKGSFRKINAPGDLYFFKG